MRQHHRIGYSPSTHSPRAKPGRSPDPPPIAPQPSPQRAKTSQWLAAAALLILAGAASRLSPSHLAFLSRAPNPPAVAKPLPPPRPAPPPSTGLSPQQVYQQAKAAVVTIDTPKRSTGSGVFINRSGILLTNHHVVENFPTIKITTADGQVADGRVLSIDAKNDLAVVIAEPLSPSACLAIDPLPPSTGQVVYALGSPLRMDQTFTNGIVSRHSETGEVLHTAAIAPGSSGSPLLNDQGRIVGINRAVLTKFTTISIAIPVKAIQQLNIALNCEP